MTARSVKPPPKRPVGPRILAIGGGGYTGPQGGPSALHRYILELTGKRFPKVCYVPTAQGDRADSIQTFMTQYNNLGAHTSYLSLYHLPVPPEDLREWVLDHDAIFVAGGNTRCLLALWREWGLDAIFREAWHSGVLLAGGSAGAICWHEEGCSDFVPREFRPLAGLGWLPGSFCPHYSDEKGRREAYLGLVGRARLKAGYACTDRAAVLYEGSAPVRFVVEWPEAAVFRVEKNENEEVGETRLEADLLK